MIPYFRSWGLALLAVLVLNGCAAQKLFGEGKELVDAGKTAEGLAKLEQAVKEDPGNVDYRIYLNTRKEALVFAALARADDARSQGRLADAESAYRDVLSLDPRNQPARMGMEKLVVDRRHRQLIVEAESLFKKGDFAGASEFVHTILNENPQNREAKNLEARLAENESKQSKPETQLAASFRKPVSFEFRDAPLRSVFEVVSKVSGINFIFDKDIRPDLKVTIFVKNSSVEDTIRLLSVTNQLESRVLNENSILIYPNTPQKIKDYQELVIRSFYLANAEAKQVANTLKTLLKTKDLVVNEKLNLIIMRDTADAVFLAEKIVALEDLNEPEVMLEVEVLEVKRSRVMNLGVQWPNSLTLATPADLSLADLKRTTSETITANLSGMSVSAKKDDSDVRILANPRIRVKNREKAKILIGERVPIVTTTSTSTGFVADSVSYVDVGLKLEVEPNIYLDDEVSIKVQLEVSSIGKEVLSKSGTLTYQIGTRNANTVLRLRDGETQILAGLINDEDRTVAGKVPGLGDLPIVGRMFSLQNDDSQKTEIVLSITPRLVRTIRRPDMLSAAFDSGTETTLGGRPLSLNSVTPPKDDKVAGTTGAQLSDKVAPRSVATVDVDKAQAAGSEGAPAKGASDAPNAVAAGGVVVSWQGPAQVRAGDQFSLVLNVRSESGMRGMATLLGFDPAYLQVVSVNEGEFLKKGGGDARFSNRIDPVSGKVFLATVRQEGAVNGGGALATVNFKAVRSIDKTRVQVLSMTPELENESEVFVPVPIDFGLSVN